MNLHHVYRQRHFRRAIAVLLIVSLGSGCQTVSDTAQGIGFVTFVWSGILLLLPVAIISAPPALIFEGLDGARAGVTQAEFSPDGSSILFAYRDAANQHLYVVPTTGGMPRAIATNSPFVFDANWSPDGNKIIFVSSTGRRRNADIYQVDENGDGLTQLTDDDALELGPQFSHDGSRIVFSRWILGEGGAKFVGASIVELTLDTSDETVLSPDTGFNIAPRYIGEDVIFVRASEIEKIGDPDAYRFSKDEFWLHQRESGNAVALNGSDTMGVASYTVGSGLSSPVIYEDWYSHSTENLVILEPGTAPRPYGAGYEGMVNRDGDRLTKSEPTYSPDHAALLFTMEKADEDSSHWNIAPSELHEVHLASNEARQLTNLGKAITGARYSRQGDKILFLLNERPARSKERHSLWVMNRDGSEQVNLDIETQLGSHTAARSPLRRAR